MSIDPFIAIFLALAVLLAVWALCIVALRLR